jgi:hypothetical protein
VLEIVWINGGPNASLSSLRSVRVGVKSPMILSRRTSATVGRWGIVGMGTTLGQPWGLPTLCGFSKLSLFSQAWEAESNGHSSQLSNSGQASLGPDRQYFLYCCQWVFAFIHSQQALKHLCSLCRGVPLPIVPPRRSGLSTSSQFSRIACSFRFESSISHSEIDEIHVQLTASKDWC